jgi:ribosome maturation factor RimP
MSGSGVSPDLRGRIEAVLARTGLELVDLSLGPTQVGRTLRILVDKEGGAGVVDCEKASRALGTVMEEAPELGGRFILEVSSAGLERPLLKEGDYTRFQGREARVKFRRGDGTATMEGILEGLEEGAVLLRTEQALERIPLGGILKARLVFRYGGRRR